MISFEEVTFTGASSADYTFAVYPLDITGFTQSTAAVYIVARRTLDPDSIPEYELLYCGACEDLRACFQQHPRAPCFARHGANCLCVHPDGSRTSRALKEEDLLDAYAPVCNG